MTLGYVVGMKDDEYARMIDPESPLDPGIAAAVRILRDAGIETYESCEGGEGHSFLEPTVRFYGGRYAGWQALGAAQIVGLPVWTLRRFWDIEDGEPVGPHWEIVFRGPMLSR